MQETPKPDINEIYARLQGLGQSRESSGFVRTDPKTAVLVEKHGSTATVTLNRPQLRNALDTTTWMALATNFKTLGEDENIRAVTLQGAGGHFSAGADVGEILRFAQALDGRPEEELQQVAMDYFTLARNTLRTMDTSPFAIFAKMQRTALGIGNILALACDRRIADGSVKTGIPAGHLGIMLDPRETRRLVLHSGIVNTGKMLFSGDIYNAEDSLRMRQIDTLVLPPDDLDEVVQAEENKAAKQSRGAIITAKASLSLISRNPGFEDEEVTLEQHYQWAGQEAVDRINKFQNRRTAQ